MIYLFLACMGIKFPKIKDYYDGNSVICFLEQEEKYIKYVDRLQHMLNRYHCILTSLDNAEVSDTLKHSRCEWSNYL